MPEDGRTSHRRRLLHALTIAVLTGATAVVSSAPRAHAAAPTITQFQFTSAYGDIIGDGASAVYTPSTATIGVSGTDEYAHFGVDTSRTTGWHVALAPPRGQRLRVGTYAGAHDDVPTDTAPSLDIIGWEHDSCPQTGSFTIREITVDPGHNVTSLSASFETHCGGPVSQAPPLRGRLEYNVPTTVTLTSGLAAGVWPAPSTFTATVDPGSAGTPAGIVVLEDSGAAVSSATLDSAGRASFAVVLAPATHVLTAVYRGDRGHAPDTSAIVLSRVDAPATVSLFSYQSLSGDWVGQGGAGVLAAPAATVHLEGTAGSAALTARDPAGDDWTAVLMPPLGQQLHVGTYTGAVGQGWQHGSDAPGINVFGNGRGCGRTFGEFTITAIGWDSAGHLTALKASFSQHCEQPDRPAMRGMLEYRFPTPLVTLLSSALDPIPGQPVTLTATVLSPTGVLSRAVTFASGSRTLGHGFLDRVGHSSLTTAFDAGTSSVTCTYPGDLVNDAGTSPPVVVSARYPTRTTLTVAPAGGSNTLPVVLVARVTGASGVPSGTVTFLDGGTPIGAATLLAGEAVLTTSLPAGTRRLVASYGGDEAYRPSTDPSPGETVTP